VRVFALRFEDELLRRIPELTGKLKKSVVFGRNGTASSESMEGVLDSLELGDTITAGSSAGYWGAIDLGLHVGADGRPKGSRDAPNGMSAEALAAAARRRDR
jgi:hypothetical protein